MPHCPTGLLRARSPANARPLCRQAPRPNRTAGRDLEGGRAPRGDTHAPRAARDWHGTGMHVPPAVPQSSSEPRQGEPCLPSPAGGLPCPGPGTHSRALIWPLARNGFWETPGREGAQCCAWGGPHPESLDQGTGQSPRRSWAQGRPAGSGDSPRAQENPGTWQPSQGRRPPVFSAPGTWAPRGPSCGRGGCRPQPCPLTRQPPLAVPTAHLLAPGPVPGPRGTRTPLSFQHRRPRDQGTPRHPSGRS